MAAFHDHATTASIAQWTGYSQKSVQTCLAELQDAGLVRWARRRGSSTPVTPGSSVWSEFLADLQLGRDSSTDVPVRWLDAPRAFVSLAQAWRLALKRVAIRSEAGRRQVTWEILAALGDPFTAPDTPEPAAVDRLGSQTTGDLEREVVDRLARWVYRSSPA